MLFTKAPGGYYIAHNATVYGDVTVGEDSSFWFSSVVRGDVAPIRIGKRVNVQDCVVIHCDTGVANEIGNDITIGHGAIIHGASVGDGSLIGMGATLLSRSKIGKRCLIAAGAVVAPDMVVPDGMLVMGVPGKIARPVRPADLEYMDWLVTHYIELAQQHVEGKFTPLPR